MIFIEINMKIQNTIVKNAKSISEILQGQYKKKTESSELPFNAWERLTQNSPNAYVMVGEREVLCYRSLYKDNYFLCSRDGHNRSDICFIDAIVIAFSRDPSKVIKNVLFDIKKILGHRCFFSKIRIKLSFEKEIKLYINNVDQIDIVGLSTFIILKKQTSFMHQMQDRVKMLFSMVLLLISVFFLIVRKEEFISYDGLAHSVISATSLYILFEFSRLFDTSISLSELKDVSYPDPNQILDVSINVQKPDL